MKPGFTWELNGEELPNLLPIEGQTAFIEKMFYNRGALYTSLGSPLPELWVGLLNQTPTYQMGIGDITTEPAVAHGYARQRVRSTEGTILVRAGHVHAELNLFYINTFAASPEGERYTIPGMRFFLTTTQASRTSGVILSVSGLFHTPIDGRESINFRPRFSFYA